MPSHKVSAQETNTVNIYSFIHLTRIEDLLLEARAISMTQKYLKSLTYSREGESDT